VHGYYAVSGGAQDESSAHDAKDEEEDAEALRANYSQNVGMARSPKQRKTNREASRQDVNRLHELRTLVEDLTTTSGSPMHLSMNEQHIHIYVAYIANMTKSEQTEVEEEIRDAIAGRSSPDKQPSWEDRGNKDLCGGTPKPGAHPLTASEKPPRYIRQDGGGQEALAAAVHQLATACATAAPPLTQTVLQDVAYRRVAERVQARWLEGGLKEYDGGQDEYVTREEQDAMTEILSTVSLLRDRPTNLNESLTIEDANLNKRQIDLWVQLSCPKNFTSIGEDNQPQAHHFEQRLQSDHNMLVCSAPLRQKIADLVKQIDW